MTSRTALLLSLVAGFLLALVTDRASPPPSADTGRGTEAVFANGLHVREIPPRQGPQRWMGERAVLVFRHLPKGDATLEVTLDGQRGPVLVAVDGVLMGTLPPGTGTLRLPLPSTRAHARTIELRAPTFLAGDGRRLGALVRRVALSPGPGAPDPVLALVFALPVLAAVAGALVAGFRPLPGFAMGLFVGSVHLLALWPGGAVRSGYAWGVALLLAASCCAASGFARFAGRSLPNVGPWAYAALLAALVVQVVFGTSPLMVVSDAVFHANKLAAVARGDWFPLSVTQHAEPFRFPYGVSFYAVLVPLARLGLDQVLLVRVGAAVAGVVASAALFLLLRERPRVAAGAVMLLQMMPATSDIAYSYGNLSNGFAQALTVLFFCWWAGGTPGGWFLGALLFVGTALGHFSSLVVLVVLTGALLIVRRRTLAEERTRLVAAGLGAALALAYYAHFFDLVAAQLPRLREGGGAGGSASLSILGAVRFQVLSALGQWGIPVVVLAVAGRLRVGDRGETSPLNRDLRAFVWAGALLALPALVSPLEVRYLYALTLPLAVLAGEGLLVLHERGGGPRLAGWAFFAAQAVLGVRAIVEAVVHRYRA